MEVFLELFAGIKERERQAVLATEQQKQVRLDGAKAARDVLVEILDETSFCRALGGDTGKRIFTGHDVYDSACTHLKARNVQLEQLELKHIVRAGRSGLAEWLPALRPGYEPQRRAIAMETKKIIDDFLQRFTVDVSSSNNLHRQLRSAGGLAGAVREVIGGMIATGTKSITYGELRRKINGAAILTDDARSRCATDEVVVFSLAQHNTSGGDARKRFNDLSKKLEQVYVHTDRLGASLQRQGNYEHKANAAERCNFDLKPKSQGERSG
jgi:hypothetical protein